MKIFCSIFYCSGWGGLIVNIFYERDNSFFTLKSNLQHEILWKHFALFIVLNRGIFNFTWNTSGLLVFAIPQFVNCQIFPNLSARCKVRLQLSAVFYHTSSIAITVNINIKTKAKTKTFREHLHDLINKKTMTNTKTKENLWFWQMEWRTEKST